jgi:hypothetical protein
MKPGPLVLLYPEWVPELTHSPLDIIAAGSGPACACQPGDSPRRPGPTDQP